MTLNDADRLKLAEIERRLLLDPTLSRVFRRRRRLSWNLVRPVLCAVLAYLVSLVVVSLVTGGALPVGIPVLLALPPVAVTVALLRWPGLLRLPISRRHR